MTLPPPSGWSILSGPAGIDTHISRKKSREHLLPAFFACHTQRLFLRPAQEKPARAAKQAPSMGELWHG